MSLRDRAARSPLIRQMAGKPPLAGEPPAGASNPSAARVPDADLWQLRERYEGKFELPPIAFGTARDFADSTDHIAGLAGSNHDMKDLQRCWTVKAILGRVPAGARLLEIGAGEPLVAGILSRLGYDVVVVDPYDGSGNGPREYGAFKTAYPDVEIIREQFPPSADLGAGGFGAVYSISVLEHVPLEAIDGLTGAAAELVGSDGCQIHAVDHVLAGWGADEHLEKLRRIAAGLGLSDAELTETIERATLDPETYFVSADAHNRWRGELGYDQYPMRRIISVELYSS